jgi:ElaB/YqjD/DUF883 family membrane-anchored ribosome-binding protein
MSGIKNTIARKAVKATAKHTAHGTASKVKRDPVRAVTLLGIGGALGAVAGFLAARGTAGQEPASL